MQYSYRNIGAEPRHSKAKSPLQSTSFYHYNSNNSNKTANTDTWYSRLQMI